MVSMARPKNQTVRRQQLVGAAESVIAERGLVGLRVKDVADRAGLSPGLVSYYYPDLDGLVIDVHEHGVERFYWARMRSVEGAGDARQALRALVSGGIPDGPEDPLCRMLYELHLHASRDRTHALLMTGLFDREVSVYSTVLQQGHDRGELDLQAAASVVATNAVALEDAYGLHIIARNSRVDPQRARELILGYLSCATATELAERVEA